MTEPNEDSKRFARVTADVAPEVAQALKVHCAQHGLRLKQAVSEALTQYVERGAKPARKGK